MYNTGNKVPSNALEDMADNTQVFDALVTKTEGTTTDRLGRTRRVFQQILMDMGFQPLAGSFQTGATITARNQTLYDEASHVFYSWGGTLPKVVSAGSTPATAGGIGAGAWVDRTDLTLRSELTSYTGFVTVSSFGAIQGGDLGVALEAAIQAGHKKIVVDGDYTTSGKTINLLAEKTVIVFTGKITHLGNTRFTFSNPTSRTVSHVTLPVYRDNEIVLADASGIKPTDMIRINTSTIGETEWNYKRQWCTTVQQIVGNTVKTNRSSTFNFQAADITDPVVFTAERRELELHGLSLNTESITTVGFGWVFNQLSVAVYSCYQYNSRNAYSLRFSLCYDCIVEDLVAYLGAYPTLFSGCSNVSARNITGYDTHHTIATGDFTDGVWVDGCFGTGANMESHPAFDVHYNNCDIISGSGDELAPVNLRSVGGSIRNSKFRHKGSNANTTAYVQNVVLTDIEPYEKDCRFDMENVSWYENSDGTSHPINLSIEYGHDVTLRNVRVGGDVGIGITTSGMDVKGEVTIDGVKPNSGGNSAVGGYVGCRGEIILNNARQDLDAVFEGGIYHIRPFNIGVNGNRYKIQGTVVRAAEAYNSTTLTKTLRIHTIAQYTPLPSYQFIELDLTLRNSHKNAGRWQHYRKRFNLFATWVSSGGITLAPSSIYGDSTNGNANDTGGITIAAVRQTYNASGSGFTDNYIEIDVVCSDGGRTAGILDALEYELTVSRKL